MRFFERLFGRREPVISDPVAAVIGRLSEICEAAGTKRIEADFLCYFSTEAAAAAAAAEAETAGYATSVGAIDETHSLQAVSTMDLEDAIVRRHIAWFEELARRHSGEYDGWGAQPSPARG